ncbi:MAG: hypothetical protein E7463_09975 [Ruminococcaceae bacterium]|nr:hypothetical protein [Oscillospiraceae bacterium]
MTADAFTIQWVLEKIKNEYPDDIALAVIHNPTKLTPNDDHFGFFIPVTKRGEQLARTFILEGVGLDVWGVSWERVENFAALNEYYVGVLPDAEVIYARTPADAQRFEALQKLCLANLADPIRSRRAALESFERAKGIFTDLMFADSPSDLRCGAGYVLDFLARAIAFTNHTYFKLAQMDQLTELARMENVPAGFTELYTKVMNETDGERQIALCREIIALTGGFLEAQSPAHEPPERNFQDLSDWYAELAYTWLRIRHYTSIGRADMAFMSAIMLQNELYEVCADFGLAKMELIDAWNPADPAALVARADALEQQMREIIVSHGAVIHEYATQEAFLREV